MHIANRQIDIIVICEVIPKAQILPMARVTLTLDGFTEYLNFDPEAYELGKSGLRGVAVYVRSHLHVQELKPFGRYKEQIWLRIEVSGRDYLLLGGLYRSPSAHLQASTQELLGVIQEAVSSNPPHLLICGDFNTKHIDWEKEYCTSGVDSASQQFLEGIQSMYLFQHVVKPTRYREGQTPHILDLVLSNEEGMVSEIEYLPGLGSSDHVSLHFVLNCGVGRSEETVNAASLNWHRADLELMRQRIIQADLVTKIRGKGVQQAWDTVESALSIIIAEGVPARRPSKKKHIYINRVALSLRRKKERLWKRYLQTKQEADFSLYATASNKLRKLTRKLKYNFEKSIAESCKVDVKRFWNYANRRLKTKSGIETLNLEGGGIAKTDAEKVEALSKFFESTFTREDVTNVPTLPDVGNGMIMDEITITKDQVISKLKSLNPNKAPGPDGLHPKVLKECANELGETFQEIYNKSLHEGTIPHQWKDAIVKPIYKKGSRHEVGNYRPVSLTSVVGKTMEWFIKQAVMDHLSLHDLIVPNQHGFVPKRSCETQLLNCFEKWSELLESNQPVDVLYLDFKKAFDAVPHKRLIRKMEAYGLGSQVINWLTSYLTGRRQRVVINGTSSGWTSTISGIPQGSILGPLCFILFINDLPRLVENSIVLFADDVKLFGPTESVDQHESIQNDLNEVIHWTHLWQLPLNLKKCAVLHLGQKNPRRPFYMGQEEVRTSTSEKDLGVIVDENLKFHEHTAEVIKKARRILAIIKRTFSYLDRRIFKKLYQALVRPILEYGNIIWGPMFIADQKKIEGIQRRATKLVVKGRNIPYQTRMQELSLPSLSFRRKRGDMIAIYKMISGLMKTEGVIRMANGTLNTRGHHLRLEKQRAVRRIRRHHITVRSLDAWNSLPEHVVSSTSLTMFKANLDKFWHRDSFRHE